MGVKPRRRPQFLCDLRNRRLEVLDLRRADCTKKCRGNQRYADLNHWLLLLCIVVRWIVNRKSIRIDVETDSEGRINISHRFDEIGHGESEFDMEVKLIRPDQTGLSGILDVESPKSGSDNKAQPFELTTGDSVKLGRWKLSPEQNQIKLIGQTQPRLPNGVISLEFNADTDA